MSIARTRWLPSLAELRDLLSLALPIVTVQVGIMAMGVVDTIAVGHFSGDALAAVALGNLYFFATAVFGFGTLMALDPVISQAVGAGDEIAVSRGVQRGLLLAFVISIPSAVVLSLAGPMLRATGQPPDLVPIAAEFVRLTLPSIVPLMGFTVLRQTLQAKGRLRPIVYSAIAANLLNAALNWVLVFGHLGFSPMGAAGSARATHLSRWVLFLSLAAAAWPALRPDLLPLRREAAALQPLWRQFALGAPIGLQYGLEYGIFALVAIFMGWLGKTEVAAHQIAINIASLTFMVPLGVAAAAAVQVGHAVGRGDPPAARNAARSALATGAGFMAIMAALLIFAPGPLSRAYTDDGAILALSAILIPIAGMFQVFDGLQVVAGGVLRGIGDTRAPMIVNLIGFWLFGLPVSLLLGFRAGWGAPGLWWGLVVGLVAVALILLARVRMKLRGTLVRVEVDRPATAA